MTVENHANLPPRGVEITRQDAEDGLAIAVQGFESGDFKTGWKYAELTYRAICLTEEDGRFDEILEELDNEAYKAFTEHPSEVPHYNSFVQGVVWRGIARPEQAA